MFILEVGIKGQDKRLFILIENIYTSQRCDRRKSMKINDRNFFAAARKKQVSFRKKVKNNT